MNIRKYIIDGNNLIGKIYSIHKLQKFDPQASREKLAFLLERYFFDKKVKVSLHFDGYAKESIKLNKIRIIYSESKSADDKIKEEIDNCKNPKLLMIVSSDLSIIDYARANACNVTKCEDFKNILFSDPKIDEEKEKLKGIDEDEIKRIFGVE